jgi:two-component system, sensor histidine kinase
MKSCDTRHDRSYAIAQRCAHPNDALPMSSSPRLTTAKYFFQIMAFVTVFCVGWQLLVSHFETAFVQQRVAAAEAASARIKFAALLDRDLDSMRVLAYEYGVWDATYAFAESRDPDFITANVLPSGDNPAQIDFFVFWDAAGATLAAKRLAPNAALSDNKIAALKKLANNVVAPNADKSVAHIAVFGGEVYLLGVTPILRNDGSGPSRGTLLFARPFSTSLIESYSTLIGGTLLFNVSDHETTSLVQLGPGAADSFAQWLAGDRAVGTLRITRTSALSSELESGETIQFLFNALGTAMLVSLGALLVRRRIIVPLSELQRQLQQRSRDGEAQPVHVRSSLREIQAVTEATNGLIAAQLRTRSAQRDRDAAQAADRLKSMFLATMSHEIRTPLSGLVGALELASDAQSGTEREQFLRIARSSSEHLMQLLDDVLDFSRIEADQLILHSKAVCVQDIVHDAVSMMRPKASAKNLAISIDLGPPLVVNTDPLRLRQVIVNLLSNAIKFSVNGSIDVTIERLANDLIALTVADRGIGIPAEHLDAIFDAFRQVRSDPAAKHPGTGLGLAISRRLMQALGGGLTAHARAGGGAVFTLTLAGVHDAQSVLTPSSAETPVDLAAVRDKRILLVEDDESIRAIISTSLSALGAKLTEAVNGNQALKLASSQHFDLILMDRHMPAMDGLEAARRLRATPSPNQHTPIFAITASTQMDDQRACLEAGMSRFIGKPIKLKELAQLVARELQ